MLYGKTAQSYNTSAWFVSGKIEVNIGRLKIRVENISSMKIRANDIDLVEAERFDSLSSVISASGL